MGISTVPSGSGQKIRTGLDQETLRIGAALNHIRANGNLDAFPASRGERVALVTIAAKQGLLEWSRIRKRYELTPSGHRRIRELQRTGREALASRHGVSRASVNAVVSLAAGVVIGGAAFLAFHADAPESARPGYPSQAYSTRSASQAADRALVVPAPARETRPSTVPAAAIAESAEPAPGVAPAPRASVGLERQTEAGSQGEATQPLAVPISTAPVADPKPTAKTEPERPEGPKASHPHRKKVVRNRGWDARTRSMGYAYAPYPSGRPYAPWGASGWGFR